jgi:short-subunit dehydrogenase
VNVTTLCPGPTQSEFFNAAEVGKKSLSTRKMPTSREVADEGLAAMFAGKRTIVHGTVNRFLVLLQRVVAREHVIGVTRRILEP